MAQKIVFTDDLDGSHGARTVTFSVDGKPYEIDISPANISKLHDALAPFVAAARKPATLSKPVQRKGRSDELRQIREWASKNGFEVSPRGRIPAEVIEAYGNR